MSVILAIIAAWITALGPLSAEDIEPPAYDPQAIVEGEEIYRIYCASCHGSNNPGEDLINPIGSVLVDNDFIQMSTDDELLTYLKVGRAADHPDNESNIAMPAQAAILDDEQLTQVIAYMRALNDPALSQYINQPEEAADSSTIPDVPYEWVRIVDNLDNPLYVTHANDSSGRLFAVEQAGYVLVVQDGRYLDEPFLDLTFNVPDTVYHGGYTEQGLLGIAFHPDYANNGYFYVSYINRDGDSVISRYSVSSDDPNRADPDSEQILLTIDQPFEDHNGGNLAFGPEGYLYVAFGDGGRPAEPNNRSQEPASFIGKMLRLDVDNGTPYAVPEDNPFIGQESFAPEIWALGLRNPWRFSFDRATGDLFIADVGQWIFEEINYQAADSPGGQNYGWSAYEANASYLADADLSGGELTMPVLDYTHDQGCSVTGGYVYRGETLTDLQGLYIYGDYCNGRIWTATQDADGAWNAELFMATEFVISSFGEDEDGELYLVDYKGAIYRLQAATAQNE
jgi:glucose/arabinose dehydrogenase